MNELYQLRLQEIKRTLSVPAKEADSNPDMWYEVFVTHDDGSTESIDSVDTFDEAAKSFLLYCEIYGGASLSIDIWQNREHPEPVEAPTPELRDGQSYIIRLKNGRKIYRAEYHHCTLSGKHYFAKGDDVYPIETVITHSMKECQAIEEMPAQILTDHYCGHPIEVTFTSVIPRIKLEQIPDTIYDCIMEQLKENVTDGTFEEEDTGDMVYVSEEQTEKYTVTAGSWRVIQLDQNFLARICLWVNNYADGEGLTREIFAETYGNVMGNHYAVKWESEYRHNILAMVNYFGYGSKDGQKFCDMVIKQMTKYEQRTNHRR